MALHGCDHADGPSSEAASNMGFVGSHRCELAFKKALQVIRNVADPVEAIQEMIEHCSSAGYPDFWRAVRKLPFSKDLAALELWLKNLMESEPPPPKITAFWFGLFNPIDAAGQASCALYIAGSDNFSFEQENDEDWPCGPVYFPDGRYASSEVLKAVYLNAYRADGPQVEGEFFCLWYSAIAVAHLCRKNAATLLQKAEKRAIAVGFDSGDILMVGRLTPAGFVAAG